MILRDLEDELTEGLACLQVGDMIDDWSVEYSDRSEARYVQVRCGAGRFSVRIAAHPVQRPGPQFCLGPHAGADSADVTDAIQAVTEWALAMRSASGGVG